LAAAPYPSLVPDDFRPGPAARTADATADAAARDGEDASAAGAQPLPARPRRAPQRRHSVAAPERLQTMLGLWARHLGVVASLSQNPLPRAGHFFAGRSGARADDDVAGAAAYRRRLSAAGVAVGLDAAAQVARRLDAATWAAEAAYIEALAESNDYSLEDPEEARRHSNSNRPEDTKIYKGTRLCSC
jgi:hypothetical protein